MKLLYFSPVPWNSFSQRPHYFVRWYQARFGGQIVWIDPYPSRFPKWADLQHFAHRRSDWQADKPSWLRVIHPRLLPIEPIEKLAWVNRWLWKIQMKYEGFADVFCGEDASIKVVIAKNSDIALMTVMKCKPDSSMCDVMDDFAAFHSGIASARLRDLELAFLKLAKTVWVSSTALFEKFSKLHSNTHCVFNGLESSAFQTILASAYKLDARPVAGYVGPIS